ncbi:MULTISPECIES: hypothetical protein [Bacteroidota]|jgi:hypothetical protein|uniref:Uncharacterized protein n=5 Tax=Bacteroidota TaxID=976 RepID=A0A654BKG9_SPHMU|nr:MULTISPECIES: hypothetical protein [Bacteroidota]HRN45913.1 hypothetical protein [Flavobacterium sp.]ALU27748.1 hypothetical protein AS202_17045 [Myroides odoratimimus]EHM7981481.1 hypothetical protein [Elizabethkingia anophelis]EHM8033084.1 hypothetical protein [Elizabethkingia anophelis]EHZ9535692.1 hypothetical protein [Elizabethkingia anophelis]
MDKVNSKKIKINCSVEQVVDIFFQLHNELYFEGKPLIGGNPEDLARIITNSFLDSEGKALDPSWVKTMLVPPTPSREYKVFIM